MESKNKSALNSRIGCVGAGGFRSFVTSIFDVSNCILKAGAFEVVRNCVRNSPGVREKLREKFPRGA